MGEPPPIIRHYSILQCKIKIVKDFRLSIFANFRTICIYKSQDAKFCPINLKFLLVSAFFVLYNYYERALLEKDGVLLKYDNGET